MAKSAVLIGEPDGGKIYQAGRVGFDAGSPVSLDSGSQSYTGTLKSERISPAGEGGLCVFRRVALRVLRSGSFEVTMKVYVDDEQTKIYSSGSTQVDQAVVISRTNRALGETVIEADLEAVGTFIQVEIVVESGDVTGVFLPESIETHYRPIKAAKSRGAETQ